MREALVGNGEGEEVDNDIKGDTDGAKGDGHRREGLGRGRNDGGDGADDTEDNVWEKGGFEVGGHEKVEGSDMVEEDGMMASLVQDTELGAWC